MWYFQFNFHLAPSELLLPLDIKTANNKELQTLIDSNAITDEKLANILRRNNDGTILDSFSTTTWRLLHKAYNLCTDKSQKQLLTQIELLLENTCTRLQAEIFLISQPDFDVNENIDVCNHILDSQDAWAQLILLSRPNFTISPAKHISFGDDPLILTSNFLLQFIEKMRSLKRPNKDAVTLLHNIFALRGNGRVTESSARVVENHIGSCILPKNTTEECVQLFFSAMTQLNDYVLGDSGRIVKYLLIKLNFNISDYDDVSSAAFKDLPQVHQAQWLENLFSEENINTINNMGVNALTDTDIFVARLMNKHLPTFVEHLSVSFKTKLSVPQIVDFRMRKIYQLIENLSFEDKNKIRNSVAFIRSFLGHQLISYSLEKKAASSILDVSESSQKRKDKMGFLAYIFERAAEIYTGDTFSLENCFHHCREAAAPNFFACLSPSYSLPDKSPKAISKEIDTWMQEVILHNRGHKGSHTAKILACLPDLFIEKIIQNTNLTVKGVRAKAFSLPPALLTIETCWELMSACSSTVPSGTNSGSRTPANTSRANAIPETPAQFHKKLSKKLFLTSRTPPIAAYQNNSENELLSLPAVKQSQSINVPPIDVPRRCYEIASTPITATTTEDCTPTFGSKANRLERLFQPIGGVASTPTTATTTDGHPPEITSNVVLNSGYHC